MRRLILVMMFLAVTTSAYAESIPDWNKLADAIYKAENSKSHPYGIMVKYKHTTPRQACINTIKHKWADFKALKPQGDVKQYLPYLASKYAPVGALNDPSGLNKNWVKNVSHFYYKEI